MYSMIVHRQTRNEFPLWRDTYRKELEDMLFILNKEVQKEFCKAKIKTKPLEQYTFDMFVFNHSSRFIN